MTKELEDENMKVKTYYEKNKDKYKLYQKIYYLQNKYKKLYGNKKRKNIKKNSDNADNNDFNAIIHTEGPIILKFD
jgi:hypothetical protein